MKFWALIVSFSVIGLLGATRSATAQHLTLSIDDGLVTLDATNVTVDEILSRWTAVTGLNVVSKSGVGSDAPVTLRLSGVSEREALQTVLRDLSGYIMGERRDPETGLVSVDRLLILPESASQAPDTSASRFAAADRRSPFARGTPPAPIEEPVFVEAPSETDPPVELAPAPGLSGSGSAGSIFAGPGAVLDLTGEDELNPDPSLDIAPQTPPAPTSPFGNVRGAARPGELTPQQQEP